MSVFRRSLGEDKADYYTHTWSVFFLLFLALVTWLLPLSPYLQLQNGPSTSSPIVIPQVTSPEPMPPRFKATCWCPAAFSAAMVVYSQATCSGAYNLAIQGIEPQERGMDVTLNEPFDLSQPFPKDPSSAKFKPIDRKPNSQIPEIKVKPPGVEEMKQREKTKSILYFIQTKTPFVLFLLAVCLKIPHLVWTLLSSLTGGINIDQTLTSAKAGTGLSYDSRRQLHGELANTVAEKVRLCSWVASFLYLLLKVLMCVAVIAELLVVHKSFLPQAQSLEDDFKLNDLNRDMNAFVSTVLNIRKNAEKNSTDSYSTYSNKVLLCKINIRQMADVVDYTLQCIFQAEREDEPPKPEVQITPPGDDDRVDKTPRAVLKMYVTVFLVVQTFLAVLTVVNVSSFFMWLLKLLARPCKPMVCRERGLPLDACLLLHMAHENTGPEVAKALSNEEVWGNKDGKKSIPLTE